MLVLLFACTAEDLAALDLPVQDSSLEDVDLQTRVLTLGPAYLTDDSVIGSVPEDRFWFARDFDVLDWSDDRVQVRAVDDARYELELWLERPDLDRRVAQDTVGWSGDGEVELPAGQVFEELWVEEDATRIRVHGDWLTVETWVEHDDVDEVWRKQTFWHQEWDRTDMVFLSTDALLLEHPDGDVFAWFTHGHRADPDHRTYAWAAEVLDFQDDHALVRFVDGPIAVTGWTQDFADYANGGIGGCGGGYLSGGGGLDGFYSHTNVPAGTEFQAPDGTVVGLAKKDLWLALGPDDEWGRTPGTLHTLWGQHIVWMDL